MATTVSSRTRDQIKAALENRGPLTSGLGAKLVEAVEDTSPIVEAIDPSVYAGKVKLSSLVTSWDHARGSFDPWVTINTPATQHECHIPAAMDYYRPNQEALSELAYAVEYASDYPIWISGDPGVGKSTLNQYLCSILRRPFFRFNYSEGLDSTALLGTQKVVSTATGPQTEWHDGFVTEALRVPNAIIVHDEFTAGGAVSMAYQRLFEKNGVLILNEKPGSAEDKIVQPASGVSHVICDNTRGMGDTTGKFIGTAPSNTATLDRVGTVIVMDYLSFKDEVAMLNHIYPKVNDKVVKGLVKVAELCRTAYRQGTLPVSMSPRVMQTCLLHLTNTGNLKKALAWSFTNRFDTQADVDTVNKFVSDIMGAV